MKFLTFSMLFVLLVSCSSAPTKEQTDAFDKKMQSLRIKGTKSLGPSGFSRIPLKSGQWITFLTSTKEKGALTNRGVSTFKVLKVSGKNVTMEVESIHENSADKSIIQYQIENYPSYTKMNVTKEELEKMLENLKISKIIMKMGTEPAKEMPTAFMPKSLLKDLFANGYRVSETKNESCSSSFLKSKRCMVFDFEATALGFSTKGKSYGHSDIPVMSFIKSDADNNITEVINYGMSGAKSSL